MGSCIEWNGCYISYGKMVVNGNRRFGSFFGPCEEHKAIHRCYTLHHFTLISMCSKTNFVLRQTLCGDEVDTCLGSHTHTHLTTIIFLDLSYTHTHTDTPKLAQFCKINLFRMWRPPSQPPSSQQNQFYGIVKLGSKN